MNIKTWPAPIVRNARTGVCKVYTYVRTAYEKRIRAAPEKSSMSARANQPHLVDELAAVLGKADRVRIPLDLDALQTMTVLRKLDDDLVDVHLGRHAQEPAIRRADHQVPVTIASRSRNAA